MLPAIPSQERVDPPLSTTQPPQKVRDIAHKIWGIISKIIYFGIALTPGIQTIVFFPFSAYCLARAAFATMKPEREKYRTLGISGLLFAAPVIGTALALSVLFGLVKEEKPETVTQLSIGAHQFQAIPPV